MKHFLHAEKHWTGVQLLQREAQAGQVSESEEGEDLSYTYNQMSELLLTTQSHWYIKVKSEAAVYMAAVLEYIVAEVVDLSNVGG